MRQHIRAIESHESKFPDPIRFDPGEALTLSDHESEYAGWIWVTTPSGNQGWAPEQLISTMTPTQGVAKRAYSAAELDAAEGEVLTLHEELNEWLWVENDRGQYGWIPKKKTTAA